MVGRLLLQVKCYKDKNLYAAASFADPSRRLAPEGISRGLPGSFPGSPWAAAALGSLLGGRLPWEAAWRLLEGCRDALGELLGELWEALGRLLESFWGLGCAM